MHPVSWWMPPGTLSASVHATLPCGDVSGKSSITDASASIGLPGIGTQGAVYSVLSRTKSFDKVGRGVYRLKPDWEEKRRKPPVRTVTHANGDGASTAPDGGE